MFPVTMSGGVSYEVVSFQVDRVWLWLCVKVCDTVTLVTMGPWWCCDEGWRRLGVTCYNTAQLATWNTFEYMNNKDVWCTRRMGTWVVALCHLSLVTTNIWSSSLYHLHCNIFIVSFLEKLGIFHYYCILSSACHFVVSISKYSAK